MEATDPQLDEVDVFYEGIYIKGSPEIRDVIRRSADKSNKDTIRLK
jgi:hypothetical protein